MNDIRIESLPDGRDAGAFTETEALFAYVSAAFAAVILRENAWRLPSALRSLGAYHEFVAELHGLASLSSRDLLTLIEEDRPRLHALFAAAAEAYEGLDRAARRHTREPLDLMPLIPAEGSELEANALSERVEWFRQEEERRRPIIDPTLKQLTQQLNTARELLEKGQALPGDDLARLRNDIDATGDRLLAKAWFQFQRFAEWQSAARLKRPEEIAADIADLDREIAAEGRSHDRDQLRDSMRALHDAIEAGVAGNLLTLAKRLGAIVLPPLPPINLVLFDDLDDRRKIAEKIAAHYRQPPIYFEAHEIAGLAAECAKNPFASTRFTRILASVFKKEEVLLAILHDLAQPQEALARR